MSKSLYTIRGFNAFEEGRDDTVPLSGSKFNSFGTIEQFKTFDEKTVEKQHEAIVEMLRGAPNVTFSARNLAAMPGATFGGQPVAGLPTVIDVRTDTSTPIDELVVIDVQADVNVADKAELKAFRKQVVETFLRWAEKSRVRGSRGWRVSAVKSPKFEKNPDTGRYTLKTQVLLGTAVFYDEKTVKIGVDPVTVNRDLGDLKHHLNKATGGLLMSLRANHSVVGKVSL